jgi:Geranylgeranyl pyrophosphate synthase
MAFMSTNDNLPEFFAFYHKAVEAELKESANGRSSTLFDMLKYHMGWQDESGHPCHKKSGKFVRSTLCLLSCQAVGGDTSIILPAAASLELIHNFSLIHDDIQDASWERHNRPTLWKLWGQPQAINAGDAMLCLAYLTLLKLKQNGVTESKIIHSTHMLNQACMELCEGQYLDIDYESRLDINIEDYINMIAKKTAALIAASTLLGAYLSTEDERIINCLHEFGKELGLAYQIRDDILGIWGIAAKIGKSKSDISQRKKTLPVVYGLENSKGEDRKMIEKLYTQESIQGEDITEVVRILDRLETRDYAQKLLEQYYHQALAQLDTARLDISRQAPLREASRFLVERDY